MPEMSEPQSSRNWPSDGVAAVLVLALLIQGLAGVVLRGLYADGAFFVTQMLAGQSFVYAPSRWMSNVIAEFPAMTAIKLGIDAPDRVALIFSVTTNVLPGMLFLFCGLSLPAVERRSFVFPAFVYFAGTLASQFASVTEGLVSTAYVWLLFYLILFGRLSAWRLSFILVFSIGCLRLHEEMSFLGPLLIVAGCLRWRDASPSRPARLALLLALLAILAGTVVGSYWILFPYAPEEKGLFASQSLLHQWWLYVPGAGWNLPAALGLLSSVAILVCITAPKFSRTVVLAFGIIASILSVASFWTNVLTVPAAQFYARHNGAFLSFPLMILVLVARLVPAASHRLTAPPVQCIVMILGVTASLWHIQATEKWLAFLTDFRTVLVSNNGIVPSTVLLQPPGVRSAQLAQMMIWSWTNPDLSILAVSRRCVSSIVANTTSQWQPYDLQNPSTLPRIPGLTYTYLLSPDRQPTACSPTQP